MKRSSVGIQKEPTIMIIPMIDIVFFLLVFFMMSTLYMNTEEQIPDVYKRQVLRQALMLWAIPMVLLFLKMVKKPLCFQQNQ